MVLPQGSLFSLNALSPKVIPLHAHWKCLKLHTDLVNFKKQAACVQRWVFVVTYVCWFPEFSVSKSVKAQLAVAAEGCFRSQRAEWFLSWCYFQTSSPTRDNGWTSQRHLHYEINYTLCNRKQNIKHYLMSLPPTKNRTSKGQKVLVKCNTLVITHLDGCVCLYLIHTHKNRLV